MNMIVDVLQKNLGFSWKGFIIVMLAMIPNILFVIIPPSNMTTNDTTTLNGWGVFMNILEHGTRFAYIILFIFITKNAKGNSVWLLGSGACLLVYYFLWIQYFMNGRDYALLFSSRFCGIPFSMAVFPILYFIFSALWLESFPIVGLLLLFSVGHIWNTYAALQKML